jgi:predicted CoA-binding protein
VRLSGDPGQKAYPTIAELPVVPDILNVFRRPEVIPALADEILALPPAKRPAVVWLQSGITHEESEKRLEKAGIKVVSDSCLGVYAARVRR